MTRSHLFLVTGVVMLAALASGCADHPTASAQGRDTVGAKAVASQTTRFGVSRQVLEAAADLGYNPQIRNGRTLFCKKDANTGSIIARYHCVDAATVTLEVMQSNRALRTMEQGNTGCYNSNPAACGNP